MYVILNLNFEIINPINNLVTLTLMMMQQNKSPDSTKGVCSGFLQDLPLPSPQVLCWDSCQSCI